MKIKCAACGKKIDADEKECPFCGEPLETDEDEDEEENELGFEDEEEEEEAEAETESDEDEEEEEGDETESDEDEDESDADEEGDEDDPEAEISDEEYAAAGKTAEKKPANVFAILGFIFSLFGESLVFGILGLIFSLKGYANAPQFEGRGKGIAIAGVVISIASLIIFFVVSIIYGGTIYEKIKYNL